MPPPPTPPRTHALVDDDLLLVPSPATTSTLLQGGRWGKGDPWDRVRGSLPKGPPSLPCGVWTRRIKIGEMACMGKEEALEAVKAAKAAWDGGLGEWPQMTIPQRCECIKALVLELKKKRSQIVEV